jgi:dienelactone hydrolase
MGSYDRCLVRYQVEQDEWVQAYLLIPHGQGPFPAIVACHQHADEFHLGKSEPVGVSAKPPNAFGLSFCEAGFLVICPDNLCFEDRRPGEEARRENPYLEGMNYERQRFMGYLLEGSTLQTKYISDLCRAVDVLESLNEADPSRIGVCGHSLGGQEAFWLAWYDQRVRCAASSCGFAQLGILQKMGINHNFAMYLPGLLTKGDYADVVSQVCPKPLFLSFGAEDPLLPMASVQDLIDKSCAAYEKAGCGDRFKPIIFAGGHAFSRERQEAAIGFIKQCLA